MVDIVNILNYVRKLSAKEPEKGSEVLVDNVKDLVKEGETHFSSFLYDEKEGLPALISEFGAVFLKASIRILELAIEKYVLKHRYLYQENGEKETVLVTGKESLVEERVHLLDFLDYAYAVTKLESLKFLKADPERILELLPEYFKNYGLCVTTGFELVENAPGVLATPAFRFFIEEKYIDELNLSFNYRKALRAAYKYWSSDSKEHWLKKILEYRYPNIKKEYRDDFKIRLIKTIKPEDRGEALERKIAELETGKPEGEYEYEEIEPLFRSLGTRMVGPPRTAEDMKSWGLREITQFTTDFVTGKLTGIEFSHDELAFGRELSILAKEDPSVFVPVSGFLKELMLQYETEGRVVSLVASYVSDLFSPSLPPEVTYDLLLPFLEARNSGIRLSTCRVLNKILKNALDNAEYVLTREMLGLIKIVLFSYTEDKDPAPTRDYVGAGSFGVNLNSTRGYAYLTLNLLYYFSRRDGEIAEAIKKQIQDPNPYIRLSFLWHGDYLYNVDKELFLDLLKGIMDHEDRTTRAAFLPISGRFAGICREGLISFWTTALYDNNEDISKSAFEVLLTGYFFDDDVKQLVDNVIFRPEARPLFRKMAANEFVQLIGTSDDPFPAKDALLKLLGSRDEGVIRETFRILVFVSNTFRGGAGEQDLRFDLIKDFLPYLAGNLSGDETTHAGFETYQFFKYIDCAGEYYPNECFEVLFPIAEKLMRRVIDKPVAFMLRDSIFRLMNNDGTAQGNVNKGKRFLKFLTERGDNEALKYLKASKTK